MSHSLCPLFNTSTQSISFLDIAIPELKLPAPLFAGIDCNARNMISAFADPTQIDSDEEHYNPCLLYTSPSPRDS